MSANGRTESPYSTAGHHMYNGSGVVQPPSPISPPLPPMPTPHDMYNNQGTLILDVIVSLFTFFALSFKKQNSKQLI